MDAELPASILCVDDDPTSRDALAWFLQREGFRTQQAATGEEALRLAAQGPDAIILDVALPDMDGFEVCRRIKAHPATAAVPVLHISGAFVHAEDRTAGLNSGGEAYLTKPVEPREVVAAIRALLRIHRAEEAARGAAAQWQATFDAIHDALWLLAPGGRVVRCNRAMAELLGQPVAEVIGKDHRRLLETAFGAAGGSLADLLATATEKAAEVALGNRCFRMTAYPVDGVGQSTPARAHLLVDITQHKALEEALRQAQKMEAVGRLAGGIAHEFNNLLTVVTSNLALAVQAAPAEGPLRPTLVLAENAAWHAADLTRQLLGFSRRRRLAVEPLRLSECIDEVLGLLRRTLGPGIELVCVAAPNLWLVKGDRGQIIQVLMNLCLNGRDAMPAGGRLTVAVDNAVIGEGATGSARPGEYVRLRVTDTGEGIAPEHRARIFEPFFTTKEPGRGTGLGLAMVFGIVSQHSGWVECESEVGKGSTFTGYFPRLGDEIEGPSMRGAPGTIAP
jgi:signal transduction histidine kinase